VIFFGMAFYNYLNNFEGKGNDPCVGGGDLGSGGNPEVGDHAKVLPLVPLHYQELPCRRGGEGVRIWREGSRREPDVGGREPCYP